MSASIICFIFCDAPLAVLLTEMSDMIGLCSMEYLCYDNVFLLRFPEAHFYNPTILLLFHGHMNSSPYPENVNFRL